MAVSEKSKATSDVYSREDLKIKKKKKKGTKKVKDESDQNQDYSDVEHLVEKVCTLCQRPIPVFFFKNEEQVKRLPERSLTPLLLLLKDDMQKKAAFLKYLKVSTKFIEACSCVDPQHSYCLSAQVTRSKKIFCHTCKDPYKYFIKEEKICNTKLLKLIATYIVVFVVAMLCTSGLMIIDGYMKFRHVKENPDQIRQVVEQSNTIINPEGVDVGDATIETFEFWLAIRWNLLIPISIIILIILLWCFYFTYQDEIALRQRIVYLEVRPKSQEIQRIQSKQNLNVIIESNSRRKNNNSLFDKLWYTKRQEAFRSKQQSEKKFEGYVFDGQGFVAHSSALIKVTDKEYKESIVQLNIPKLFPTDCKNNQNLSKAGYQAQLSQRRHTVTVKDYQKDYGRTRTMTIPELSSDSSTSNRFDGNENKDGFQSLKEIIDKSPEDIAASLPKINRKPTLQVIDFAELENEEEKNEPSENASTPLS